MSDLLNRLETHAKLGLDASPGFFLSTDDLREIVRVMKSNEGRFAADATDPTDWTPQERSFWAAGYNARGLHRGCGEAAPQEKSNAKND